MRLCIFRNASNVWTYAKTIGELSDVVLSGDGVGTGTFTKEELMEILG